MSAILIAADGWHDEVPGGANRMPTDFARYLANRGHHVIYLCASPLVGTTRRSHADGVELRRYPTPTRVSPSPLNAWHHLWRAFRIARDVGREPGVAVLLGHNQLQYLGAALACSSGTRRCYAVHSPFVEEQREGVTGPPTLARRAAWRGAALIERRILALSDVVHLESEYTRTVIERAYPGVVGPKGVVLPGWVDARRFQPAAVPKGELRRRLGSAWPPDETTFFTLRRLVPRMGLDTLVDAVVELARDERRFHVVIGGEGSERAALEARAAAAGVLGRIAFAGRIAEADLAACYAAADCFVLPSRALECFGLIVLESYAAGVPVIGVPVGAIPETMGPENAAWIAADHGARAIAARMRDFLDGRLRPDPARLRARAEAFDLQVVARLHEDRLVPGVVPASSGPVAA